MDQKGARIQEPWRGLRHTLRGSSRARAAEPQRAFRSPSWVRFRSIPPPRGPRKATKNRPQNRIPKGYQKGPKMAPKMAPFWRPEASKTVPRSTFFLAPILAAKAVPFGLLFGPFLDPFPAPPRPSPPRGPPSKDVVKTFILGKPGGDLEASRP